MSSKQTANYQNKTTCRFNCPPYDVLVSPSNGTSGKKEAIGLARVKRVLARWRLQDVGKFGFRIHQSYGIGRYVGHIQNELLLAL